MAKLGNGDMAFIGADECLDLALVLSEVDAGAEVDQLNVSGYADFVCKNRIDRRKALALDELDEVAKPAPDGFGHRKRDVLPESLCLDLLDQGELGLDRWN